MLPDVGGTEYLVIAAVALIVIGPKDLPKMMRKVGEMLGRMRAMAAEFRASFDEMARQSELDDLRREVEAMRAERLDPMQAAVDAFNADTPSALPNSEPELPLEPPPTQPKAKRSRPKPTETPATAVRKPAPKSAAARAKPSAKSTAPRKRAAKAASS